MTRLPNPELAEKIKQVCIDELTKNGIENISMRKIAKKTGITPTTIYYYFTNKSALFEAIKKDGFEKLNHYVILNINKNNSYTDQLSYLIRLMIEWILKNKNLSKLILDKLPPNLASVGKEKEFSYYYDLNNAVINILIEGKRNNEFNFDNAEIESNIGFAIIYGITTLYFNKRISPVFWENVEPLINRGVELLLSSLIKK